MHLGDWFSFRLYAAVGVAVYTGLRRDELLCLRMVDVDLAGGMLFVVPLPERDLKTPQSVRPVPICPELAVILAAWMPLAESEWLFPGVRRRGAWRGGKSGHRPADELKAACVAAGIVPGTWQWMRRAWAVHAETAWFFTDPAIDRVMGHSPGSSTSKRWYRRADLDNLRALGQRITYQHRGTHTDEAASPCINATGLPRAHGDKTRRPPPVEFPWMAAFGWYELTDSERPGWRAICETIEDVEIVLAKSPVRVYRLIRRGPQSVAFRPIARWDVARGPSSGKLAFCRLDADRSES